MEKRRHNRLIMFIGIILFVIIMGGSAVLILMNRVSDTEIPHYIESGEYNKVVKAYKRYVSGSVSKEKKYDEIIDNAITDIVLSWSSEKMGENDAIDALAVLSTIDNADLSKKASQNKSFVEVESEAEKLYDQAEVSFEKEEYLKALKALVEIDKSYSQYAFVKEFIGECEEILIAQISYPTSIDQYEEYEGRVDEYLEVVNSKAFVRKKEQLQNEYNSFVAVVPTIEQANKEFEDGSYSAAFGTLENARKEDPTNRFLNESLEELHNIFVVKQVQMVSEEVKEGNYDQALKTTDEAIEIYDCKELSSLRKFVLEKKHPLYGAANNIVDVITSAFSEWTSEDYDVKKDNAEAYIIKSGKKLALGDYDEDEVTVLSVTGEVATALAGVDVPLDVRDLTYDVTHWGEGDYFALRIATDTIALVPVIGAVKYLKYSKEASKGAKAGVKTAESVIGGTTEAAKATNRILDAGTDLAKNADESAAITKVCLKRCVRVKTGCHSFAGKVYPHTNIKIVMKKVKYSDGRRIEGAFPVFKSHYTVRLPVKYYKSTGETQKKWLCRKIAKDAKEGRIRTKFTKKELSMIKKGEIPEKYVWHHHEKEGWMQLVDRETHESVSHKGGMSLWGRGYS